MRPSSFNPTVAIVVPTLDEGCSIEKTLVELAPWADELIVSDGGSQDDTVTLARQAGAVVVTGPPGRGIQLNRGAAEATAEILLFVHADTQLPAGSKQAIQEAVCKGALGGGFSVRFDSPRKIFRLGEKIVALRTRLTQAPLGDQAQFVVREAFESLGGYPPWPILEDVNFIRRLGKQGRLAILELKVKTAARRFVQRGITRTIVTNWLIWLLYLLGVSPHRLAALYRHVR